MDIQDKLDKIFNIETTDMEYMLSMLDIKHSIVIDNNVGLIGEFDEDSTYVEPSNQLMRLKELNEKRGDSFLVVGEMGTIIISEKVSHTFIIQDNEDNITRYAFILKDNKTLNEVDTFFEAEAIYGSTIVIYDTKDDSLRTNDRYMEYKYDKHIRLEEICNGVYRLSDNFKEYTSISIDVLNNISIFMEITGNN